MGFVGCSNIADMKRLSLAIYFCLSAQVVLAQETFRPGYIITHKGDTLSGEVRDLRGATMFHRCDFRRSAEAGVLVFTGADIAGYGVEDQVFVATVIGEGSPRFVQRLVQGPLSLYRHEARFFVAEEDDVLHALVNDVWGSHTGGRRTVTESNRYRGVMAWLMSDCEELRHAIERVGLYQSELTSLVERYNACRGESGRSEVPVPAITARVGLAAGFLLSRLEFGGESEVHDALKSQFVATRALITGVTVDLTLPRIGERVSLHTGLLYRPSAFRAFRMVDKHGVTERHFVTVDLRALEVPLGINYSFMPGWITPYVQSGLAFRYRPGRRLSWMRETEHGRIVDISNVEDIQVSAGGTALWAGVGFAKKVALHYDLFLECRYGKTLDGRGAGEPSVVRPSLSGFQFSVGLRTR